MFYVSLVLPFPSYQQEFCRPQTYLYFELVFQRNDATLRCLTTNDNLVPMFLIPVCLILRDCSSQQKITIKNFQDVFYHSRLLRF